MKNYFLIFVTALVGTRHIVIFMLFLGMANAYVMRTNMSVAIVAMVNHTAYAGPDDPVINECRDSDAEIPPDDDVSL